MKKKNERVVKNRLSSNQWFLLDYLKENAIGKENAISGDKLAEMMSLSKPNLRKEIKKIRVNQDIVIGSCRYGYYIPLEEEYKDAVKFQESKTLSHIETCVVQRPEFILELYSFLNHLNKTVDKTIQNQVQMKLTGYENDTFNKFGDKYKKEFLELDDEDIHKTYMLGKLDAFEEIKNSKKDV